MSNESLLKLYTTSCIALARSIRIKSSPMADLINKRLSLVYGSNVVNPNDPSSWLYYKNQMGVLHPSQPVISVTSLDTLEVIPFDIPTLALHVETSKAYKIGTRYYESLVATYPDQLSYIHGVIYPATVTDVVNAPEGDIVAYDTALVEPQETTLISTLREWSVNYHRRYFNTGYLITDPLYPQAFHCVWLSALVSKIINIRLSKMKTSEAHGFHIRQYFSSEHGLDTYIDYLNTQQKMFLYRNLDYITHNPGSNDTIGLLVDNLFTSRGIPMAKYNTVFTSTFDQDGYPLYKYRKIPMNTLVNEPETEFFTQSDIDARAAIESPNNLTFGADIVATVPEVLRRSNTSTLQTKMYESSMIDYTDSIVTPLYKTAINYWAYGAATGAYRGYIYVSDPRGKKYRFSISEGFAFGLYLTAKIMGVTMVAVPGYYASRVLSATVTTYAAISPNIPGYMQRQIKTLVDWLAINKPVFSNCITPSGFLSSVSRINRFEHDCRLTTTMLNTPSYRRVGDSVVGSAFVNKYVTFDITGLPTADLLSRLGIVDDYTPEETALYLDSIVKTATGTLVDPTKIISNIQAAMVGIMRVLCAYSSQFFTSCNTSRIVPVYWPMTMTDVSSCSKLINVHYPVRQPDTTRYGIAMMYSNAHHTSLTTRSAASVTSSNTIAPKTVISVAAVPVAVCRPQMLVSSKSYYNQATSTITPDEWNTIAAASTELNRLLNNIN